MPSLVNFFKFLLLKPELIFLGVVLVVLLVVFTWVRGKTKMSKTPTLAQYSRDLTALAAQGRLDPVIGREHEIERVIQVLSRRSKNNPVLVGKSGVGKTAIAEGLAEAIVAKRVPQLLYGKRVLSLDLANIVAGTKYRGEFEQRLKRIADEIIASQREIILFIDEIHTLAEAGEATGAIGADDILKPALARGDLQVVGATTRDEYLKFIKKDATLDRRLHPIMVDEPSLVQTLEILRGIKARYERHHGVTLTDAALKTAVDLAARRIPEKSFPDKAIDLIDEAASRVGLRKVAAGKEGIVPTVNARDVQEVLAEMKREEI
ncbi:MAG: ATP-dependent Clp protease ATP-binding subunit ClpC [Parcubacteria group bacterium Gr01-1014_31]|nr:MAG: ATP-dependent Clp protease ATP-binding subunit ClpC [Parcubacteria group bacterium Gr01-1014_31]